MSSITGDLDYALELFRDMQRENLSYIYRGIFSQKITDNILSLAEGNLTNVGESSTVKKRVFSIMVEGLQNITRHQDENLINEKDRTGIFVIQRKGDNYFITTGNLIDKNHITKLTGQLNKINSLEKDELKKYYKEVLNETEISKKGGAGLGLIEMARKSGNKLAFDFTEVTDTYSFFYLHLEISRSKDDARKDTDKEVNESLKSIKGLHKILNKENILLIFNGIFNQDSLINLLTIIEGHMSTKINLRKRVFNIMVEMLQNIVKHAGKGTVESGNPGIFFISEKNNLYLLNTGNYVLNSKVEELRKKIDYVNELNETDLNNFYNKSLFNFEIDSSKESGLGLIEIRLKSQNKLKYTISKVDEQFSFFALQTGVN
ncbi:MAG: hypothetical protein GXO79_00785 [Chlorobi bacterium]|nr:hypothetical protein [Chlorobiota bacterium]